VVRCTRCPCRCQAAPHPTCQAWSVRFFIGFCGILCDFSLRCGFSWEDRPWVF
jgi:hypothetical protein